VKSRWATLGAPVVFVLIWSTGFIGSRYIIPYAPPLRLLSIRLALAAVIVALLALAFRSTWPKTREAYSRSAVIGIMLHAGYLGCVFVAIGMGLPVAVSALIVCLQPVCVAALSKPVLGESLVPRQWVGVTLGLLGVVIVLSPGLAAHSADYSPLALGINVAGLVFTTAATLLQKKWGGAIPLLPGTAIQYAAAAVVLAVLGLAFESKPIEWVPPLIAALAWMVFALSIGGVLLMFWMLRTGTAASFSALYFLIPPVTLLMGWAMFDQTLPPIALIGLAVSSVGVLLVRERAAPKTRVS